MKKSGSKKNPGKCWAIVPAIFFPVFLCAAVLFAETVQTPKQTWRAFEVSYNRVWNAMVRVVVKDSKYAVRAADPEEGFLSTWPKSTNKNGKTKVRTTVNANVKKAPEGTLVTVSCVMEEFVAVQGAKKGRWVVIPSDGACEASLIDAISNKIRGKK